MSRKKGDPGDWDSTTNFRAVFHAVYPSGTKRQYRLFMCGCCRHFLWTLFNDDRTKAVIETAEMYADSKVVRTEVDRIKRNARTAAKGNHRMDAIVHFVLHGRSDQQAADMPYFCLQPWQKSNVNHPTVQQQKVLCELVRDIFGNSIRPVAFAPAWRTSTAIALAESMYAAREFGNMPILADALEEAGCDNADILSHCRGDGPHVRGCWVVDLVLGKS